MSIRAKIKVDLLSKIEASSSGVLEPMNFSVLILSTFFQTIDLRFWNDSALAPDCSALGSIYPNILSTPLKILVK